MTRTKQPAPTARRGGSPEREQSPTPAPLAAELSASLPDADAQLEAASRLGHRLDSAQVRARQLRPATGGRSLPAELQQKMESSFGADLSSVRIHEDSNASRLGARAYARGEHIHFAPGEYQPGSSSGQTVLGHELSHVLQQRAGRVSAHAASPVNLESRHESEADAQGARAARGEPAQLSGIGPQHLQATATPAAPAIQGLDVDPFADLDPFKANKQQAAQQEAQKKKDARKAELKKGFNIVADDHQGPLLPNQLKSAEFDQVADLHENIHSGNSSLKFKGGNPDILKNIPYMQDIRKILQTPSGRSLLGTIANGPHEVSVSNIANPLQANAQSKDPTKASDGTGTGGAVEYALGKDVDYSAKGINTLPYTTSDTVLFHELTHAYHYGKGTRKLGQLTNADVPLALHDVNVNKEEYATVGLGEHANDAVTENSYRAQQLSLQQTDAARKKYQQRTRYTH